MIKAVIFDLDGTLLYTIEDLRDSVNYALGKAGLPPRGLDEVTAFVGHGVGDLIRKSAAPEERPEVLDFCLREFRQHYRENMENKTRPYDGIPELLSALSRAGIKTGILSNKFDAATKRLSEKYFGDGITLALGERPETPKKPDPAGLRQLMRELHVLPRETVYVGDSPTDVKTAKNAEVRCIAVTWGYRPANTLLGADYTANTPADVLAIVRNITK